MKHVKLNEAALKKLVNDIIASRWRWSIVAEQQQTTINTDALYEEFLNSPEGSEAWKKARRIYKRSADEFDGVDVLWDEFQWWATETRGLTQADLDGIETEMIESFAGGLT